MSNATKGVLRIEQVTESDLVVESNLYPKDFIDAVAFATAMMLIQEEEPLTVMKAGELFMNSLAKSLKQLEEDEIETLDNFPHVPEVIGGKN